MFPTDKAVLVAATEFRAALDAMDRKHWERFLLPNFPRGACGHCSEMLALYLTQKLGITPDYVSRNLIAADGSSDHGHAWLEWDGLLIDISGDQFGWEPVVVTRSFPVEYLRSKLESRHPWKLDPAFWGQHCSWLWREAKPFLPHLA